MPMTKQERRRITRLTQLTTEQQIAHIKEHQDLFTEANGYTDIEAYFRDYEIPWEQKNGGVIGSLYFDLCSDMGIEPRKKPQ